MTAQQNTFVKHAESGKVIQVIDDQAAMIAELAAVGVKIGKTSLKELIAGKRETVSGCTLVVMHEDGSESAPAPAPAPANNGGDAAPAAPKAERAPRAKATIKAYEPKGKIKPVRKGTKIANGLEMLKAGATLEELQAAADKIGDDPVDFCNRRIAKRGYGIEVKDNKFFLKLQASQNGEITYTASAADSDEGDKEE